MPGKKAVSTKVLESRKEVIILVIYDKRILFSFSVLMFSMFSLMNNEVILQYKTGSQNLTLPFQYFIDYNTIPTAIFWS